MSDRSDVLVVEDDLPTRELYVYILTRAGIEARAAHNGRQALEMCRQQPPAVVLTDLRLPGLDGYALARELHAELGDSAPPIIAVTGFVPADDDPRVTQAHFQRLLVKPVMPALLVEAVQEALKMANANAPSNPTRPEGPQPGQDPTRADKHEPATTEQAGNSTRDDREEPRGRASKGTAG